MSAATSQDERHWHERLVARLKKDGVIKTSKVEAAMLAVPRFPFAPAGLTAEQAYENKSVTVHDPHGQAVSSLSQPSMVAAMLEALTLTPGMRVLEIGAGSGYNAALMAHLVGGQGRVAAVDLEPWLVERARTRLAALGVGNVDLVAGDGALGHAPGAPYDRIVATTGTWEVFPAWFEQLAPRGRLLLPLEFGAEERERGSVLVDLAWEGRHLEGELLMGTVFVPMRGERGGARAEERTEEGVAWQPSSSAAIGRVKVYPKAAEVQLGEREKLFERGLCKVVLETRR